MRIRGTCANCGREFLPEQVVAAGGHCPWCGKAFNRDYTALLVEELQRADQAGDILQDALEQIADIEELAMEIDEESVLEPLREALRAIKRRRARV
jgi:predicted Zn-ribbon and HTH transcriptional regulator